MTGQAAATLIADLVRLGCSRRTPWPQPPVLLRSREGGTAQRPNNAFKPNPLRYAVQAAGKACHLAHSPARVGFTKVLGAESWYDRQRAAVIASV